MNVRTDKQPSLVPLLSSLIYLHRHGRRHCLPCHTESNSMLSSVASVVVIVRILLLLYLHLLLCAYICVYVYYTTCWLSCPIPFGPMRCCPVSCRFFLVRNHPRARLVLVSLPHAHCTLDPHVPTTHTPTYSIQLTRRLRRVVR